MQTFEIIQEIENLSLIKKFHIVEETLKSIKREELNQQMKIAAEELYEEYTNDNNLTIFNSLDLEDFYETKWNLVNKFRPAIIVNNNSLGKLPLKIIIPITDWKTNYEIAPWMIKIEPDLNNGLTKTSTADCFQIMSLSQERMLKKIGVINDSILLEIKEAIKKVIDI